MIAYLLVMPKTNKESALELVIVFKKKFNGFQNALKQANLMQ